MLRRDFLIAALGGVLAQPAFSVRAENARAAPEFAGLEGWLNVDSALSIAGLRGKVVLVDFWTYSCINCRRTIPYLNRWQAEYAPHGLQIIGVHTPEFRFEHARMNVAADVRALGIRYPVAQDNSFATWTAWRNRAWPTFYLLDQQGRIVVTREGEGHAGELEGAIRGLLGLTGAAQRRHADDDPDLSHVGSPEMYFGGQHATPQDRAQSPGRGAKTYSFAQAPNLRLNSYALDGLWDRDMEPLVLRSERGGLRMRFSAAKMHLVASAPEPTMLRVAVDDREPALVEVSRPTLYTLFDAKSPGEHVLSIEANAPGLSLFSATFG